MAKQFIRWSLKDLAEVVNSRLDKEFNCHMFIEGNTGLGKSTLAYKLSGLIHRVNHKFNPRRDIIYKRLEVLKAIARRYRSVIFADELINVAYKRDFYEHEQKDLIKALNMYRDNFNFFIGCIPRFADLDTDLQKLCHIRLTVVRRGFALVQRPVSSIYTRDPWDIKNNQKIEASWSLTNTKNPRYAKLSTVVGYVVFNDLSPASRNRYNIIKREKRNQILKEADDLAALEDPEIVFINNLFEKVKNKALSSRDLNVICEVNNRKVATVRIKLNQMLKRLNVNYTLKDFFTTPSNKVVKRVEYLECEKEEDTT